MDSISSIEPRPIDEDLIAIRISQIHYSKSGRYSSSLGKPMVSLRNEEKDYKTNISRIRTWPLRSHSQVFNLVKYHHCRQEKLCYENRISVVCISKVERERGGREKEGGREESRTKRPKYQSKLFWSDK